MHQLAVSQAGHRTLTPELKCPAAGLGARRSPWSSSWSARRASAARSPPRACSRRTSAPPRRSGRTRSRRSWWRCRSATGWAGGSPTGIRSTVTCARSCSGPPWAWRRCRSSRARSSTPRSARSPTSPRARSSARCWACSSWWRGRCCCSAPSRLTRSGCRSPSWRRAARPPAGSTRSRPPARCVGTFVAALLLIPFAGTRRTFLIFAFALALVAALGMRRRWLLVPLLLAGLVALPPGHIKPTADDGRVVYETDTEYQYARVVESPDGTRSLELNEGLARHSLYRPGQLPDRRLLGRLPRRPAHGAAGGRRGGSRSSATPAGTTARAYGHYFPRHADRRRGDRRQGRPTSGGAGSTCARRTCAPSPRTRDRTCAAPASATTRSSSTPTASRTSRSTSQRASSSSSAASGCGLAGWS